MTRDQTGLAGRHSVWLPALLYYCALGAAAGAQAGREVTVSGEIVDLSCYVKMGALGMDHKECAVGCAKAGMPMGILEEKTGRVYILVSDKEFESVNIKFQPLDKFIAQKSIQIKGRLYEKGGQQILEVISVGKGK